MRKIDELDDRTIVLADEARKVLTADQASTIGLKVPTKVPDEIYNLMQLYKILNQKAWS